ncbi:glycosyltransferase family 2 protein [Sphingobacterium sp. R2]|uniref:glycosyltransferase family 2 protein n=1 Tax=Sphingobacterium sp. R2 TaxID=3112958 RepID=UPI00345D2D56
MKSITVFTPSYNRAYCLHELYESLCRQSNQDFHWLIIDDGSSDNTKDLVNKWLAEERISMQYHYQPNKGMVGAHNTAHYIMETELCVCIDSDDFMPDDAIEKILKLWKEYGYPDSAGMVGLDAYKNGQIIGTKLPEIKECRFSELYTFHKVTGDKKFVHNRRVFNKYLPYPFFDNEKFPITSYLYLLIEQEHKLLLFNEVFCIVEYMEDGLSKGLINQYRTSPKSFAFYRLAKMKYALNYKERFKNAIHYVSSSLIAKDWGFLKKTRYKLTTVLAFPFGVLLYFYITRTKKTAINKNLNKA